ncbi:MAG: tRNA dihydrouridine synthase DusB, partial [Magnetovibrio sp.]|nr:tRNA dihydrouridine synthase DusB [Magnetovibrio sp.]
FGNGDVNTVEDARNLLQISGVDGIMVGRGTYGRPWFLEQIRHFLDTGQKRPAPALKDQCNIIIEHFDALLSHYGVSVGLRIARKHLGWYSKGLPNSAVFRGAVFKLTEPHEVRRLLRHFYASRTSRRAA